DDVWNFATHRADDRHTARHRFDQHTSELFFPIWLRARGQHQTIQAHEIIRHLRGGDQRLNSQPILQSELRGEALQPDTLRPGTDEMHLRRGWQLRHRAQQKVYAFWMDEAAGVADS